MQAKTYRQWALAFIAAYERPDASEYEQRLVRLAHRWLRMMSSPFTTKNMIRNLLAELDSPPAECGCAWDDLKKHCLEWAREKGFNESSGSGPHADF